jgi:hypothetical protein
MKNGTLKGDFYLIILIKTTSLKSSYFLKLGFITKNRDKGQNSKKIFCMYHDI